MQEFINLDIVNALENYFTLKLSSHMLAGRNILNKNIPMSTDISTQTRSTH